DLHVEGLLEELGGLLRVGNDERDVAKLGHDAVSFCHGRNRWRTIARNGGSPQAAAPRFLQTFDISNIDLWNSSSTATLRSIRLCSCRYCVSAEISFMFSWMP